MASLLPYMLLLMLSFPTIIQSLSALSKFSGIATNVPLKNLTGWGICWSSLYPADRIPLPSIQKVCNKEYIMMGCYENSNPEQILVAAYSTRDIVFGLSWKGGSNNNDFINSNGVRWYFAKNTSWGFSPIGEPVSRSLW